MNHTGSILLAFFGDDFTGSTDALECISMAGARSILFTETPTADQLQAAADCDVIGVAGKTRSLDPGEMEKVLLPAFRALRETGARHIHYKICSTFDSSPESGSIGKAIDCGAELFGPGPVPVLGGMPALGRYCLFGNLYARMGTGTAGRIYRLDRHPSMSRHPVTPMHESDLRVHLGRQTSKKIALIDQLQQDQPVPCWNDVLTKEDEVVLLDAMYDTQLIRTGQWLDNEINKPQVFSVGGSGIESALGQYWSRKGWLQKKTDWPRLKPANPLLVLSGSCSPVTAEQIRFALANGFDEVILDPVSLLRTGSSGPELWMKISDSLSKCKNTVVHTGGHSSQVLPPSLLGATLGSLAARAVEEFRLKRVLIAGGDTSSYAARAIAVDAVEMYTPLVSGAPVCTAVSGNPCINGLEMIFKGGQVGGVDLLMQAAGSDIPDRLK